MKFFYFHKYLTINAYLSTIDHLHKFYNSSIFHSFLIAESEIKFSHSHSLVWVSARGGKFFYFVYMPKSMRKTAFLVSKTWHYSHRSLSAQLFLSLFSHTLREKKVLNWVKNFLHINKKNFIYFFRECFLWKFFHCHIWWIAHKFMNTIGVFRTILVELWPLNGIF